MMVKRNLFEELVEIGNSIKSEYEQQGASWKGSPFEWLLTLPSRSVGAIGERLVEGLLVREGFVVRRPKGKSGYDRICSTLGSEKEIRLEIKFSKLWENQQYVFQQIRDQEYDVCFCLGISPWIAHAWAVPKPVIWENATGQHTGRKAKDTKWVYVDPGNPPEWMREYGGELERSIQILRGYL
jgi:hypothetical protein